MPLVKLTSAVAGRKMAHDIYDDAGRLLLRRGVELTSGYVRSLWGRGFRAIHILDDLAPDIVEQTALGNKTRAQLTSSFRIIAGQITQRRPVDQRRVTDCVTHILDSISQQQSAIMNLASIKTLDNYTFEHSINVCVLAVFLHSQVSDNMAQRTLLGESALLHDVGKLALPPNILIKPSKLTDEEYDLVKNHAAVGETIASNLFPDKEWNAVRAHHERPDGCGYPDGLKEGEIDLASQIVAIADVYDAVTSDRVYRQGMRPHQAVEELHTVTGTQLDAQLVYAFTGAIAHYPVGSILRLSSGELAVVAEQSDSPDRPMVQALVDPKGKVLSNPLNLHLEEHPDMVIEDVLDDWPTCVRNQVV